MAHSKAMARSALRTFWSGKGASVNVFYSAIRYLRKRGVK